MVVKMNHAKGERLNIRFNRKIKLEFHGARLTSDGGLLAYRELDDTLGLFNSASPVMSDKRTGRNIQHDMANLLRQSVYSRLAGYEDANDAQRLSADPAMRAITSKKKNAAIVNTVDRPSRKAVNIKERGMFFKNNSRLFGCGHILYKNGHILNSINLNTLLEILGIYFAYKYRILKKGGRYEKKNGIRQKDFH